MRNGLKSFSQTFEKEELFNAQRRREKRKAPNKGLSALSASACFSFVCALENWTLFKHLELIKLSNKHLQHFLSKYDEIKKNILFLLSKSLNEQLLSICLLKRVIILCLTDFFHANVLCSVSCSNQLFIQPQHPYEIWVVQVN